MFSTLNMASSEWFLLLFINYVFLLKCCVVNEIVMGKDDLMYHFLFRFFSMTTTKEFVTYHSRSPVPCSLFLQSNGYDAYYNHIINKQLLSW